MSVSAQKPRRVGRARFFRVRKGPQAAQDDDERAQTHQEFINPGYIATMHRMARRAETIELAVLGLLHEGPMHGYELRKRLNLMLGWGRVLSYGSLYPTLKKMLRSSPDRGARTGAHAGVAASEDRLPGHRGRHGRVRAR